MIFITQCDSPALWQIYLSDPASITMEGILIFNKHLLFLLTVIVLFVGWLLFYTIYYFIEYNNKFSSKFVCLPNGAQVEIMHSGINAKSDKVKSNMHIAISLGSIYEVDRITTDMKKAGITVLDGPRTTGDGFYESLIADPEGNHIELTV